MTLSAVTTSPAQNWVNNVQNKIHSVQQKILGLCDTDCKVYALLVLGRVLQASTIVGLSVSVGFAFLAGPATLIGLVPSIALGILGTYIVEGLPDLSSPSQGGAPLVPGKPPVGLIYSRPFVPGQPIGLINKGNNCWLNAGLQMLLNSPALSQRIQHVPNLAQFQARYEAERQAHQKTARQLDSQTIREDLNRSGVEVSSGYHQEDAAQLFEHIFTGLHTLHQQVGSNAAAVRRESMIQIGLAHSPRTCFQELFNYYFNYLADDGRHTQLRFQIAPNDLMIHAQRFFQCQGTSAGGFVAKKIGDDLDISEKLTLPAGFILSGGNSEYCCHSFLVHYGAGLDTGGHYVAYVKRGENWWCCDDSVTYEVSAQAALAAMKQGYIFHYRKV